LKWAGDEKFPVSVCAVVISIGDGGEKKMLMGKQHAGKGMKCICGNRKEIAELNDKGEGLSLVNEMPAPVWILVYASINITEI